MSRRERQWLRCIFETFFPGGGSGVDAYLEQTVASVPTATALALRAAGAAVTLAPVVVLRRAALLHQLAPNERERVLWAFAGSSSYLARSAFVLLKASAAMACAGGRR